MLVLPALLQDAVEEDWVEQILQAGRQAAGRQVWQEKYNLAYTNEIGARGGENETLRNYVREALINFALVGGRAGGGGEG